MFDLKSVLVGATAGCYSCILKSLEIYDYYCMAISNYGCG
jgi:hypothetical protein